MTISSLDLESGSSQFAQIADASQTGLDLSTALTIEFWVKPESWPAADNTALIAKSNSFNATASYLIYYDTQGGGTKIWLGISDGSNNDFKNVTSNLGTGTWHHVAITWLGSSKTFQHFVDGSQVGSDQTGANVASIRNGAENFRVGFADANQGYYDGLICEVRVWNVVRTPTQISDNMSVQLVGNETGLVCYNRLNNDGYVDQTSNNNDLTSSGSPVFSSDGPFSVAVGPANLKTWDGLATASVKTIDGLAMASVKTYNGLA